MHATVHIWCNEGTCWNLVQMRVCVRYFVCAKRELSHTHHVKNIRETFVAALVRHTGLLETFVVWKTVQQAIITKWVSVKPELNNQMPSQKWESQRRRWFLCNLWKIYKKRLATTFILVHEHLYNSRGKPRKFSISGRRHRFEIFLVPTFFKIIGVVNYNMRCFCV